MVNAIDIKAFIDERPIPTFQWFLVAMCFLVVVSEGMDVAIVGFVTPPILQEWNISRPAFGFVISAAAFGIVIGALVAGPSSDRLGRKIVLTTSVFVFGLFTILAAYSSSAQEMALLRLLAGMGMGAAMPNATTLLSEYAPLRRRSLMITVMFTGFNLGSAVIGFAAGYLIPLYGWRSVLLLGGVVPLILVPILAAFLPESARLMSLRGVAAEKIATTLGRVTGHRFSGNETLYFA
jgi:AAHS family 4-hydroxybenzoate transporter-like MFS transporter